MQAGHKNAARACVNRCEEREIDFLFSFCFPLSLVRYYGDLCLALDKAIHNSS